jgi:murein DD-endopeptidase MepM/ murein hydrolase activator NlpD
MALQPLLNIAKSFNHSFCIVAPNQPGLQQRLNAADMKKVKYYYNTHTLRYEKLVTPLRVKLLRIFGFLCAAVVSAFLITYLTNKVIPPQGPEDMQRENRALKSNYAALSEELKNMKNTLAVVEKRDNEVYRTLFEANPLPDSTRAKAIAKKEEVQLVAKMTDNQLINSILATVNEMRNRLAHQNASFEEIDKLIENKADFLAHLPAIQPVSNKDLTRIASGFGYRIDPVYKTEKFHKGLDFTAPQGTPIYATANGTVKLAEFSATGYGNHVVIDHGYGYETLYGHMVRIKVGNGQGVKRGEVIGWVGTTGKSTGPHCHYEVHKNGEAIDPVYFFYNDLSPEQFDKLLTLAATNKQSVD